MSTFSQLFPPAPKFTEANVGDLSGKVYIITGAASGVGLELAKILYSKNATVYVGARSAQRANAGIEVVKATHKKSSGFLKPLVLDLADLKTVRVAVEQFRAEETRLDVLFLNAGVMTPPEGSKSVDGYDLEIGTNCLGPFLLTRLLEPLLKSTVATGAQVRIVWVASMMSAGTPPGGVKFDNNGNPVQLKAMDNYMQSKAGELFLGHEFAQRLGKDGIISVSLNPGLMKTELQRNSPPPMRVIMGAVFKGPKFGAYTELYAGLSPDVTPKLNGAYFIPWGRKGCIPEHLQTSMKPTDKESISGRFYDWCDSQVSRFY